MKTQCYVGIDIGTTNTKAVSLHTDGSIGETLREHTPTLEKHGAVFFNLPALEKIIENYVNYFHTHYHVLGISFTSVGESVVPVRAGYALSNPLMWYDPITGEIESKIWPEIQADMPRERLGSLSNATFSLYKILWMQETLEFIEPEWWLPISSYFLYRYTGEAWWDFSHASRTMLMNVSACEWNEKILSRYGLNTSFSRLGALGTYIGKDQRGIDFFLGGHDHITGLFCVNIVTGQEPFIFDSIGSSESIVTLTKSHTPFLTENDLVVGVAFYRHQFYLLKGLRFSGRLLECFARLCGAQDVGEYYEKMNEKLLRVKDQLDSAFNIIVGGDPVIGDKLSTFSLMNVPIDVDPITVSHSAYVYLASMARLIIEELSQYTKSDIMIVTSGAITSNRLFMKYKATILGRPLYILKTEELGAVGAAICAATGSQDKETINSFVNRQEKIIVVPDNHSNSKLREESDNLIEHYKGIIKKNVSEVLI